MMRKVINTIQETAGEKRNISKVLSIVGLTRSLLKDCVPFNSF